jgi:hypothetical protein
MSEEKGEYMNDKIVFPAEVVRVQTMADGSVRVVLGLPETCIEQMALLAVCQRDGIYLEVECTKATV